MMLGSQAFAVTEWDWFQIQLRVLYLELRGPKLLTTFRFRTEEHSDPFVGLQLGDEIQVACFIYSSTASELVKNKESREKQLDFYSSWVNSAKAQIKLILQQLPTLATEFSVDRHIAFLIADDGGMGSLEVCRFVGDRVIWAADRMGGQTG
jgi:hypothetical protein